MTSTLTSLTPRVIVAFIGTWVLALFAANLVPVLIGALIAGLGMSVAAAGALATAMSLGTAAAVFATNRFVATGDRPRIARIGLLAMVAGFGLAAATLRTVPVWIGVVIGGAGAGIVVATGTAASSTTRNPDATTSTVMIVNRFSAAVLLALVPVLGNDLRTILMILAGLGVAGLLAAGGLPNLPVAARSVTNGGREPYGAPAIAFAVAFGLWSLTEDTVYAMTEILATRHVGISADASSLLLSLKIVGGLAGALLAPLALRTVGRSWSILVILVVSTVAKFLIVTSPDAAVYSVALVTWGVLYGAVLTLAFGLAARMALSGRVGVLVSSLYLLGVSLGPVVGGALVSSVSLLTVGLMVAVPSVVAGVVLLVISRRSGVSEHGGATDAPASTEPVNAAATT